MPELPEVETIRRQLNSQLTNKKITGVEIRVPKLVRNQRSYFIRHCTGARVIKVNRRAKLVLIGLTSGYTLIIHLKMTGQLVFRHGLKTIAGGHPIGGGLDVLPNKFSHVIFSFDHAGTLFFNDIRKFGFLKLVPTPSLAAELGREGYGPEPLDRAFLLTKFQSMLQRKASALIKPLLMDQTFIAGIGNIYATEVCFNARILPSRHVKTLSPKEIKALFFAIKKTLAQAIAKRGSSVDTFIDAYGEPGKYVPLLKVYGRDGQKCRRCGATITKVNMAGRGTAYCRQCQK